MKQKAKTCAHCGEEFIPLKRNGMYCSNTCRQYSYLTRKTGEIHGIVKEESIYDIKPDVPALIIEEQEEPIIVNQPPIINQPVHVYQFKEKNEESKNVNSISWSYSGINQETVNQQSKQKTETMKTEQSTNNQLINTQENIPLVEVNEKTFTFIDPELMNRNEEEMEFLPLKNYHDIFEDEKLSLNDNMLSWFQMISVDKEDKQVAYNFGQRIKPYLQTLSTLNGRKVLKSTLEKLHKEMMQIINRLLPIVNCPQWYPPVGFCISQIEEEMKFFIEKLNGESIQKVQLIFTDKLKARIEIMLMMIKAYTPVTPDYWELP